MKILIFSKNKPVSSSDVGMQITKTPHLFIDYHVEKIKQAAEDIEVVIVNNDKETAEHLPDADAIAVFPATMPASLKDAKKLRWVHSFAAGVDKILTDEVKNSDVLVSNSSGIHKYPISEHVIGFMLILSHKFDRMFESQEKHLWEKQEDATELRDKTLLIVGLGNIGGEIARLGKAFGMKVIAVTREVRNEDSPADEVFPPESLNEHLGEADFVIISVPLTDETHHLFNLERIKKMKPSAILMNIGRGQIIHEQELVEALKQKIIAGAALDVTEEEPLPSTSPLWDMENVIITPHNSGLSERQMDRAIDLLCENIKTFVKGEKLVTQVDKEKGY